jgi:DNA-binding NarL/FixJ family response regulator
MTKEKIKILIVEDHPLMRQGIKRMIEKEPDLAVIAEADNINDAIKILADHDHDIAIVDITLDGELSGIDLIKNITKRKIKTRILVLSMHSEILYIERAIKAGAHGYLTKNEAPQILIEAIRSVYSGETYISNKISGKMINKLLHNDSDSEMIDIEKMSNREIEIFELIGKGCKTGEIAKKLNLSTNTIESHRKNIIEKLNFENGNDLVKHAIHWVSTKA